jgi:hypothetical protein
MRAVQRGVRPCGGSVRTLSTRARACTPRAPPSTRPAAQPHARWGTRVPRRLVVRASDGTDAASAVDTLPPRSAAEQRLATLLASLPIGEVVDDVLSALDATPNVVLEAAPGAGKTTCLPLAILQRAKWLPAGHTILVGPRRPLPYCRRSGVGGGGSWAGAWWASGSELVVWCLLSIFSPFIPFGRSNPVSILSSTAGGEPLATTHFD